MSSREAQEMAQSEVPRVRRDDVEKAGLDLSIAKGPDRFDLVFRGLHKDKISAVSSLWSKILRNFEASSA